MNGTSTYNQSFALTATYLASAAYCGPPSWSASKLEAWQCGPPCDAVSGVSDIKFLAGAGGVDAYAYVGRLSGQCMVAFRGTSDLSGWLEDLESAVTTTLDGCSYGGKACYVGDGFLSNYKSVAAAVKTELAALSCGAAGVLVVGHSLGAAEATLAVDEHSIRTSTMRIARIHRSRV